MKKIEFIVSTLAMIVLLCVSTIAFAESAPHISMSEFRANAQPLCCGGFDQKYQERIDLAKHVALSERVAYVEDWKTKGYAALMNKLEQVAPQMKLFISSNSDVTVEVALEKLSELLGAPTMSTVAIGSLDDMAIIISIQDEAQK